MKTLILTLVLSVGLSSIALAQIRFCFDASLDQVTAAQFHRNSYNADMASQATEESPWVNVTTKQYVGMRLGDLFTNWMDSMNESKARDINLRNAYKKSPDNVKGQIETLLEPYK